jgi:RHS repeat-associated protein
VGATSYVYDANGNMVSRGGQTITWDCENRPVSVGASTFVYDGDGNRVMKTENGETILYINRYYEKNLTTGEVTTSYYLGGRLIAQMEGATLNYIHQDHLTGTSVVSDSGGSLVSSIKYFPFGSTRSGSVTTDKQFTGQRLDGTGLYYYGARYYDAEIGRFISADTIVPDPANPQSLNRYSYCLNNPLKYVDPSGHGVKVPMKKPPRPSPPPPPEPGGSSKSVGTKSSSGDLGLLEFGVVEPPVVWEPPSKTVTFELVEDNFTVCTPGIPVNAGWPLGYGVASIRGTAEYYGEWIIVSVSISSRNLEMPDGIVIEHNAIVYLGSEEYKMPLENVAVFQPYSPAGSNYTEGQRLVGVVSPLSQVTLVVNLGAHNNLALENELPYKAVLPWDWQIDLRTGNITRHETRFDS